MTNPVPFGRMKNKGSKSSPKTAARPVPVSPMEYSEKYDKPHIDAVCIEAGTNYEYWKRIRDRRQRPGVDLAHKLVAASGGELDLNKLLFSRETLRGTGAPPLPMSVRPRAPLVIRGVAA